MTKLGEAEAMLAARRSVAQIIQRLGLSEQTFHSWRTQYGGMKADDATHLKELEIENTRLKKLVADQALDMAFLKHADSYLESNNARGKAVRREAHVRDGGRHRDSPRVVLHVLIRWHGLGAVSRSGGESRCHLSQY